MLTKTVLSGQDIAGMVAAVMEYNRRGPVVGVQFFNEAGEPLPVAFMEVYCDENGLAVRSAPEDQADLERKLNPPVDNPRVVPQPASVSDLSKLAEAQ